MTERDTHGRGNHWPDMLRVAGSLSPGRCGRTTCCGCSATRNAPPRSPGTAFTEYGRIARTPHLLRAVDPVDGGPRPPRAPGMPELHEDDGRQAWGVQR
ncbi:Tn3 family transposase [Streptomyces sp. NPDC059092]|uniref:Tn3 family transposase n=1 Tax=Streptomyces sp. NPDC059092 TaxID=3346725 RepID=UPI0036D196A1